MAAEAAVLAKFIVYGLLGWVVEVVFTGACAAVLHRDRAATATTYLWMHPIYGAGMLGLEWLGNQLPFMPILLRAAVYVVVIFAVEFTTGWLLKLALGKCPWDYGTKGLSIKGFIRLDYAPAWYAAALLFEPVRAGVHMALGAVTFSQVLASAVGPG